MSRKILIICVFFLVISYTAFAQNQQDSNFKSPGIISSNSVFYELDLFVDRIKTSIGIMSNKAYTNERVSEAVLEAKKNNSRAAIRALETIKPNEIVSSKLRDVLPNTEASRKIIQSSTIFKDNSSNDSRFENNSSQQQRDNQSETQNENITSYNNLTEEERYDNNTEILPQDDEIRIKIEYKDGILEFQPDTIDWKKGETLKIILENNGNSTQNLVFDDDVENRYDEYSLNKSISRVEPGQRESMEVTFDNSGTYTFYSEIPEEGETNLNGIFEIN